ncbi:MAG: DNA helicase RecQ [bacterium]
MPETNPPALPSSVMEQARRVLLDTFGYASFRGPQAEIIAHTCAGRDSLVLMPTGGGKSLCYQLPAIIQPGLGLVVSPLIALMQDQVQALTLSGVSAAYLNSTLEYHEQQAVIERARSGDLKLLYVAPERLLQPSTLTDLSSCRINLIAIDEAHCVSSWGHDFRADYLALDQLRDAFPGVPRLALTATADPRTQQDICARLNLAEPEVFNSGFDRPNIFYSVQPKVNAKNQLMTFLQDFKGCAGIVYCLSRKSVNDTAHWLQQQGVNALPYHAGLSAQERAQHQVRFLKEDDVVMVATIAFGMGIDKPDVRFVAHLDLPKSMEAYYQETGRAGRDGAPAQAWMVYGLQDVVRLSRMVDESPSDESHKRVERSKLDALLGWCEVTTCRRASLLSYFGETPAPRCDNCDVCVSPPVTWDATQTAQKALSCVFRTGQRFGAGHVIDVLRGQLKDKVRQFEHHNLSTFAIGQEMSEQQWRSVFRQLVVRGYLQVDHSRYGALRLTGASRALLRGDITLALREDPTPTKKRSRPAEYTLELEDEELMEDLKAVRRRLAESQDIPPYMVFHDATLRQMIAVRPRTAEQLLEVSGVGRAKLAQYGDAFLEVLARHHAF